MSETAHQRIIVAGQLPPPVGGQNIMIRHIIDTLSGDAKLRIEHLPLNFNTSYEKIRRFSFGKVFALIKAILHIFKLRTAGSIDLFIYPFGGKHLMPMIRDMILIPICILSSRKVVIWFHTGGIAESIITTHAFLRIPYLSILRRVPAAIVMTQFNKVDPISLGIDEIHVIPHKIPDRAGSVPDRSHHTKVRILYIGHLYPDKGICELLRSFDQLADLNDAVSLDLAGEAISPWDPKIFRKMISEMRHSERVNWLGLVQDKDKDDVFRNASILVFPTIAPGESFGLVLAEGLMWGLPIIATDWRGASDVLTADFYGRLVNCNSCLAYNLMTAFLDLISEGDKWSDGSKTNRQIYLSNYCTTHAPNTLIDQIMAILPHHR